ncbi:Galactose oxidase/kelch repeat superfamily protein [Actinidia rufa]|uniref:Galactose oxidase/kelch repeat superfamily protein n=1 Tax=Actinidia rufa TaxID=165716 RepID=A0A7J0FF45_9ERIC|nr:Galactose oxidase/kelch repeat superfamily protein [Actinidia rufa]
MCQWFTFSMLGCLVLKWSVVGKLPYRVKTTLVGFWNGWLYFTSGQRDRGPDDPAPKKVLGEMWRTKLNL